MIICSDYKKKKNAMCHNQQNNSQKQNKNKNVCKQRPVVCILYATSGTPPHCMRSEVNECSCQRAEILPLAPPVPAATWARAACSWAEWRGCWDQPADEVLRCLQWSTLVSAAASSGSRRARWRARRGLRARPENSRTRPRRRWSVCRVLYPRWSLQKMAAPLLWIN